MRIEELSIGDWVKQKDSPLVFQVSAIREGYVEGKKDDGEFAIDTLEPILVRYEMLIANGFEYVGSGCLRKYIGFHEQITVSTYREWTLEYCNKDYHIPFNCVHELQRALRIYGLYQTANDFVICKQKH